MKNKYDYTKDDMVEIIAEELETEHDLKVLNECWHISIYPKNDFAGIFPYSQIKSLDDFGKVERIKTIDDRIPAFSEFNPEVCYLGFEIIFRYEGKKLELENLFISLREEFKIRIFPPYSNISDYIDLIDELSDDNRRIGEILKEIGALTDFELEEVLSIQKELREESGSEISQKPLGELLVEEKILQEPLIKAALKKQVKSRKNQ